MDWKKEMEQLPDLERFDFPSKQRNDIWTVPRSPLGFRGHSLGLLYWEGRPRAIVATTECVAPEDVKDYALGPAFEQSPPIILLSRENKIQAMMLEGSEYSLSQRVPSWDQVLTRQPGCVSAAQAKAVVQEVYQDNSEWYEDPKSKAVVGAVPRIFPEGSAIVYELLQNAADCGAKKAAFEWENDTLLFAHNGAWFTENDVEAISFINISCKPSDNIGFMGLGFKGVYEVCNRPQIHSDPYHFLFDRNKDGGQILPEWIPSDRRRDVIPESFTTLFRMPIEPAKVKQLREELNNFEGVSLLYTGLTSLKIDERMFSSRRLASGDLESDAFWNKFKLEQSDQQTRSFLLISRTFGPSDEAAEEFAENRGPNASADSYRGCLEHQEEVTLTVELREDGSPQTIQGTGNLQVYLPTGIELGCPFDLQGNFIIDASRQQMKSKSGPWNSEYLTQAGMLLADLLVYSRHIEQKGAESWERFYSLVPDDFEFFGTDAEEIFEKELGERQLVPVVDADGNLLFVAPEEARHLASKLDEAVPPTDIASLADIRPLWPELDSRGKVRLKDYVEVFSAESFLECLKQPNWEEHVSDFSKGLDTPEAFRRIAHIAAFDCLRQGKTGWGWRSWKRSDYEASLKECRVLLTQEETLRSAKEFPPVRLPPSTKVDFPTEEIKGRFALVNGRLLKALRNPSKFNINEEVAKKALEELELLAPALTPEQIAQDVISKAFKSWQEIPDERLLRYTRFLAEYQDDISNRVLKKIGVKVKTKSQKRKYVDPEQAYFGMGYTYYGEALERLCRNADGIDYIADCYRERFPDVNWEKFFRPLGVTDYPRIKPKPRTYRSGMREELKEDVGDPELDLPRPRASSCGGIPGRSWVLEDHVIDPPIQACVKKLYSEKPHGWRTRLTNFAKLIDRGWKDQYRYSVNKELQYYRYRGTTLKKQTQPALSSMAKLLKNQPWVPVEDHDDLAVTPNKIVLPTDENQRTAGEDTLFPVCDFSDEGFIEFLEIQQQPTEATPLSRLRYLVNVGTDGVEEFRDVYREIAEDTQIRDSELREIFDEERLIYSPDSASLISSGRVIYQKRSALSPYFIPIEAAYPDLERFFVDRLGVHREEHIEHYIHFLRDYAWQEKPPMSDEVRAGLEACYRGILSYLSTHSDEATFENLEAELGDRRFVYCTDRGWKETTGRGLVIYPNIQRYLEQVEEEVPVESHLKRLDRPLADLRPLIRLLHLTPLSRAMTEKPEPRNPRQKEDSVPQRADLDVLVAVVGRVWKLFDKSGRGMSRFRKHWSEVERCLPTLQFYSADHITVVAMLNSTRINESERCAFLHYSGDRLRLYLTGPVLEVYDDLAQQLYSWLRFDLLPRQLRVELRQLVLGNAARLGEPSFERRLRDQLKNRGLWEDSFGELLGEERRLRDSDSDGEGQSSGTYKNGASKATRYSGERRQETVGTVLAALPSFSEQSLTSEPKEYNPGEWQTAYKTKTKGWGSSSSKVNRTRQKAYGKRGERWVVQRERIKLRSIGRKDLAEKVIHQSKADPNHPYDVESFAKEPPHERILIEVKSTADPQDFDFRLSAQQIREGSRSQNSYYIYRVTCVTSEHPKLYIYPFADIWPSSVQLKSGELVVRAPRPSGRRE